MGDYRLLTRIGEGGMGVVHLAQGPDGHRVALKVLRPHIVGDDEARERLAREVASLRRVRSPRIAEVIDADPWAATPFVATRYVPGLSLHEHVRGEGPIEGGDLRWFAGGLAEALIAVHSVGVLHRDIKPSNVLLEGRSPVLIDFGLARLAEDPRLTHTGWLLGTPGYLAPEILYGEDATTASDVHSWAATVVFAATGRPPYGRGPAMAIMDRVRRGEHDLQGVPEDLLPLVVRCLAAEPADRPDTSAVLNSLRAPGRPLTGRTHPRPADQMTMPYALAGIPDRDATDVLGPAGPTVIGSPTPPTRRMPPPGGTPQSSTPQSSTPQSSTPPRSRLPGGVARFQRVCLLTGVFAGVSVGFALAPYLSLLVIALAALAARTLSWTSESARERRFRRGGSRWYDAPLAAVSTPWYLLVATGGTVLLMVWSAGLALLVGVGFAVFRAPLLPGLVAGGAVLAFSLWWGPGSRRVRVPVRRLIIRSTRSAVVGWIVVAALGLTVLLCCYALLSAGVNWDPQPGPPWRPGTLLGSLAGWF